MAIITISRGCFSHGKEIAEQVARDLGYECVSQEIVFEASKAFHLPEEKLMESIHEAPGILDKITRAREKFISYFQAALLEHVKRDRVVYHGYAGHLFIPPAPHVLKVLVIAEMEDRIAFLQKREKISRSAALEFIEKEDKNRAEWYRYICKADMNDPRLYDLVVNIGHLDIQDACRIISTAATSETRKTTRESDKSIHDLALNCHGKAALQEICDAEVASDGGMVHLKIQGQKLKKTGFAGPELEQHVKEQIRDDLSREVVGIVKRIPGVNGVVCDVDFPAYS